MEIRKPGDVRRIVFELLASGGMTHRQIADEVRSRLPEARTTAESVASMAVAYRRQSKSARPVRRPIKRERIGVPPQRLNAPDPVLEAIAPIIERARTAAIEYYSVTGRPLGITGEVGEFEAARLLGLRLAPAREPGYDAVDGAGRLYQIKTRSRGDTAGRSQSIGGIKLDYDWEAVILVLLDESLNVRSVWQAERAAIEPALAAPGSRARNERGALAVSKFKAIGFQVWPVPGQPSQYDYLQSLQHMLSEWDTPEDAAAFDDL